MVTVTAVWSDWMSGQGSDARLVRPTPGRDRPIVVRCSSAFTAAIIAGVFDRLGCTTTREESSDG